MVKARWVIQRSCLPLFDWLRCHNVDNLRFPEAEHVPGQRRECRLSIPRSRWGAGPPHPQTPSNEYSRFLGPEWFPVPKTHEFHGKKRHVPGRTASEVQYHQTSQDESVGFSMTLSRFVCGSKQFWGIPWNDQMSGTMSYYHQIPGTKATLHFDIKQEIPGTFQSAHPSAAPPTEDNHQVPAISKGFG